MDSTTFDYLSTSGAAGVCVPCAQALGMGTEAAMIGAAVLTLAVRVVAHYVLTRRQAMETDNG